MTSVLSKVCERIIAKHLARHFESTNAFGDTQWAFRTGRSRQDMIAVLFSKWMLAMNSGKKIGLYLSDISGAFDRVNAKLLMKKLARTGLSPSWLAFIETYLTPPGSSRRCRECAFRAVHHRRHGVPRDRARAAVVERLFADISTFKASIGYEEERFADDLSIFKHFGQKDGQCRYYR